MNKDIYDMRFDGSEEDLKLQDFISRAEPVNCSNDSQPVYTKKYRPTRYAITANDGALPLLWL